MNKQQEERIRQFVNDEALSDAIYQILRDAFLEPLETRDVQVLAASRIALDMLPLAWKSLLKFKTESEEIKGEKVNLGL